MTRLTKRDTGIKHFRRRFRPLNQCGKRGVMTQPLSQSLQKKARISVLPHPPNPPTPPRRRLKLSERERERGKHDRDRDRDTELDRGNEVKKKHGCRCYLPPARPLLLLQPPPVLNTPPRTRPDGRPRFTAHLHVAVLVPELVHAGKQRDSTVPHVTGVVGKLTPHLELGVTQPDRLVTKVKT